MSEIYRVLDANINRAAEGMRVLEDIARFVLNNKNLCAAIKQCRHDLRSTTPSDLYSRDINQDVGTHVTTKYEGIRESLHDIAEAASNRCAEALRVIEEFLKLEETENQIEEIRYKLYDLATKVIRGLGSTRKQQWKLCFVMTSSDCVLPWKDTLSQTLTVGCDCIQIREKDMLTNELIAHTKEVMHIANQYNVPVIVNDRVDVMLATNASGVHLGNTDMSVEDARTLCGATAIIGATAHTPDEVRLVTSAGADYIGVGAMFASPTKPNVAVVGPVLLQSVSQCNYLAIGGITPENIQELFQVGCNGVAVGAAISRSRIPGKIAESLMQQEAQLA